MKKIYIVSIVFLALTFSVDSQIVVQPKSEIKSKVQEKKEGGKYYSEYVVQPEKLKTFFISGEIPADFPKYDKYKSYDENKLIAKSWAKANKSLIKQEFWYKFED
jgi:hypothetical protein